MRQGDKGWLVVLKEDHEFCYSLHRSKAGADAGAMAILKDYRKKYGPLKKLSELADVTGGDSYIEIVPLRAER